MLVDAAEAFDVVLAMTAQTEAAANDDRAVAARRVELVQRLREEPSLQAFALEALAAERDHVG